MYFFCSCGYVYTSNLDDVNNSKGTKVGKIKSYGEEYERRLLELRYLGIKGIARLTGVNHGTIRSQLRHYDNYGVIENKVIQQKFNNQLTINEEVKSQVGKNRKNKWIGLQWQQKDQAYYYAIKDIIKQELENTCNPVRITRTRLAREIGAVHAVVYCIDKLPQTRTLIEEYQETAHMFRLRKIEWAIQKCIQEGVELVPWRVLKVSGLTDKTSDVICQVTETLIQVAVAHIAEKEGR